ncbi:protein FAR1-RELATED SEQUENCE 5-like [Arachis duranensis]|uniref:Protein FAR1-RELATED SEQUENCE 5-like n=1 Tax=Arachis duranensis TaxID=130453 RepID=A0A9C6TZE8_ARADU|nr:protein FAR1-RELATED SEQUENCE 5-like [Arachis duranensis]
MEFKISPTLKANLSAGINCPARIYVHILTDVGLWIISKVVLNHSHPCCPDRADMLKQHRELSMFVRRTIENNEEAGIRLSKTYKSFVAAGGSHRELNFIEKDVRNYITRELNLEIDHSIKNVFWADARSRAAYEYFGDISFGTTYNTHRYNMVFDSFVDVNHHGQSTLFGYAFDRNWSNLLKKYGVGGNKWLSEFEELIEILQQTFDNVMAEMQEYQVKSKSKCSLSHEDATLNDVNDLQSSPRVRTRERPNNRLG